MGSATQQRQERAAKGNRLPTFVFAARRDFCGGETPMGEPIAAFRARYDIPMTEDTIKREDVRLNLPRALA